MSANLKPSDVVLLEDASRANSPFSMLLALKTVCLLSSCSSSIRIRRSKLSGTGGRFSLHPPMGRRDIARDPAKRTTPMFAFPFTIAPGKRSIAPRRQRRTRRSSRPRSEVCSRRHLPRAGHGNGSYSSAPTKARRPGSLHQRLPDQSVLSGEYRGWPIEAAFGVLNEVSAAQDRVARALVMFSEGIGATTTIPEDAGNQPLDLGIPIYPIATNYKHRIRRVFLPRNYFRTH